MQYMIVTDSDHARLVRDVNAFLSEGWRPLGGVSMVVQTRTRTFAQALVLEPDAERRAWTGGEG